MMRRQLTRLGLALVCLLTVPSSTAGAVDVVGTSAKLGWAVATGPVANYGVFISKNGAAFPSTPNQFVTVPNVTLTGALNDTLVVKVCAFRTRAAPGVRIL